MKTAVFTLGKMFLFSVEGKNDEEIFNKALPIVEEMRSNSTDDIYMYVNNTIERIWQYKSMLITTE